MRTNALALLLLGWLPTALAQPPADDSPLIGRIKSLLGEYASIQTQEQGEEIQTRLLAMADTLETAEEDVWASQCLERAGIIAYRFAQYDRAVQIWDRGLAVARRSQDPKRIAALLNSQAIGASVSGDDQKAIRLCTELLALRQELGDVRGEGITWHNKAFSHLALFEYPEALDALTRAMRCHREVNNGYGLAGSQLALVSLLSANGQQAEALAMADSAVAAAERIDAPEMLCACLGTQAMFLHTAGRVEEALRTFERARAMADDVGIANIAFGAAVNHADALITAGQTKEALAILATVGDSPMPSPSSHAIVLGVRGRALLAVGDLDAAEQVLEAGAAEFTAMQDTLSSVVSQADALQAGAALAQLVRLYIRRGEPEHAWQQLERQAARTLRREITKTTDTPPLAVVQAKLQELDAMLLSYGTADIDGTVATLTTADDVVAVEVPYPPALMQDLSTLAQLVASGADDATCAPVLQRVSDAFLGPLRDVLDRDVMRCIVVPGSFAGLAFESLPWQGTSLGERFVVSYAPSASVLLALEARSPAGSGFLAMADPSPATGEGTTTLALRSRSIDDTPLPQARVEVEHIAPPRSQTFFGREANRRIFLEHAPDASVVHLATHALVDTWHPDYSALVLYTDDPEQPGVTARDISQLDLHADLVSLSGCRTAGGYGTGEGNFGLTRAFLVAGTRSVVSSWWDVEDGAARRFMELFYAGLREGLARDVAAQRARASMRDEGYPYRDRAAFSVTGAVSGSIPVLAAGPSSFPIPPWLIAVGLAAIVSAWIVVRKRRAAV